MGLKCSLLGHSFEPADVERERKEEGSEVVTVTREIERCLRCDEERVVSESTEVTAVVDEDEVDIGDAGRETGGATGVGGGGGAGAVGSGTGGDLADRDPEEEDTEILTDEEPEREPGAWPEEPEETWDPESLEETESEGLDRADEADDAGAAGSGAAAGDHAGEIIDADDDPVNAGSDDAGNAGSHDAGNAGDEDIVEAGPAAGAGDADAGEAGADEGPVEPDAETLSGITVPEGTIVCTECSFSVDADSSYRDGDPCPDCGAWLTSERNR